MIKKLEQSLGPDIVDLISDGFLKRGFDKTKDITLGDILYTVDEVGLSFCFKGTKELFDNAASNIDLIPDSINTFSDAFLNKMEQSDYRARIAVGMIVFSDYTLSRISELEGLVNSVLDRYARAKGRVASARDKLNQIEGTRSVKFYNRLCNLIENSFLRRYEQSIMNFAGNGWFGSAVEKSIILKKRCLKREDELRKYLKLDNDYLERMTLQVLIACCKVLRRYQVDTAYSYREASIYRKLSEIRFEYEEKVVGIRRNHTFVRFAFESAVKLIRVITDQIEKKGIIARSKPYFDYIAQDNSGDASWYANGARFLASYLLCDGLNHDSDNKYIMQLYGLLEGAYTQLRTRIQTAKSYDYEECALTAHKLRHVNLDICKFLGIAGWESLPSRNDGEDARASFSNLYDSFLQVTKQMIKKGIVPEKYIAQYKYNPYERL